MYSIKLSNIDFLVPCWQASIGPSYARCIMSRLLLHFVGGASVSCFSHVWVQEGKDLVLSKQIMPGWGYRSPRERRA